MQHPENDLPDLAHCLPEAPDGLPGQSAYDLPGNPDGVRAGQYRVPCPADELPADAHEVRRPADHLRQRWSYSMRSVNHKVPCPADPMRRAADAVWFSSGARHFLRHRRRADQVPGDRDEVP